MRACVFGSFWAPVSNWRFTPSVRAELVWMESSRYVSHTKWRLKLLDCFSYNCRITDLIRVGLSVSWLFHVYSLAVWSERFNRRYAVMQTLLQLVTLLQSRGIRSDVYEYVTCLDDNCYSVRFHNTFYFVFCMSCDSAGVVFIHVRKIAKKKLLLASSCLSLTFEGFNEIWYLSISRKSGV